MKGGLVRHVCRLLSPTKFVECKPVSSFNDAVVRGMATNTDAMLESSSQTQETAALKDKQPIRIRYIPDSSTAAAPSQPSWYRPDPVTGTWVPEPGPAASAASSTPAASTVPFKAPLVTRIQTESTDASADKTWWTSMEELPDMDRPNLKDFQ